MLVKSFFINKVTIADVLSEVAITFEGHFDWFVVREEPVVIKKLNIRLIFIKVPIYNDVDVRVIKVPIVVSCPSATSDNFPSLVLKFTKEFMGLGIMDV